MNNSNRLIPAVQRLSRRALAVPTRTFFFRPGLTPWNIIERQMSDIERQFARMERDMTAAFREFGFPIPRFRLEYPSSAPSLTTRMFPTIETQITPSTEAGKSGKYSIKIDVGEGFAPENIKIDLKDRQLTIHAKLEQKSEDGNSRIYQELSRSFTLPDVIKPDEVKSLLTPEGVLTIEAPLPEVELPQPKEIPISIETKP